MGCRERDGSFTENDSEKFDINPILRQISPLGRFQWIQLFLAFVITLATGLTIVTYAFTGYQPNYRCRVPQCENHSNVSYFADDGSVPNYVDAAIFSIPGYSKHSCQRLTFNVSDEDTSCASFVQRLSGYNLSDNKIEEGGPVVETCGPDDLVFDQSVVTSSFATRFDLVCGKASLNGIFNSCVMLGMLLFSLPIGALADWIGRKRALGLCIITLSATGTINTFVTSVAAYAVIRVLLGGASVGLFYCATVLIAEWLLPKDINSIMKIHGTAFEFGNLLFGGYAYFIRNERDLQLVTFAPVILFLIPLAFLKESARWLISKGHVEEAKEILRHAAKVNGRSVDEALFSNQETKNDFDLQQPEGVRSSKSGNFCDLFKTPRLRLRTLNSMLQWACTTATFYGMIFGAVDIFGDKYSNFALGALIGIPGILITAYTLDRFGRKWSLVITQGLSGASCIIIAFLINNPKAPSGLHLLIYLIGKFTSTVAFVCVIQMSAEMYPTPMRATATGLFSSTGRIGGIYAVVVLGLKRHWSGLPFVLFGAPSVAAALLALFFPETTGSKLPETIEDSIVIGNNPKYKPWCKSSKVEDQQ